MIIILISTFVKSSVGKLDLRAVKSAGKPAVVKLHTNAIIVVLVAILLIVVAAIAVAVYFFVVSSTKVGYHLLGKKKILFFLIYLFSAIFSECFTTVR